MFFAGLYYLFFAYDFRLLPLSPVYVKYPWGYMVPSHGPAQASNFNLTVLVWINLGTRLSIISITLLYNSFHIPSPSISGHESSYSLPYVQPNSHHTWTSYGYLGMYSIMDIKIGYCVDSAKKSSKKKSFASFPYKTYSSYCSYFRTRFFLWRRDFARNDGIFWDQSRQLPTFELSTLYNWLRPVGVSRQYLVLMSNLHLPNSYHQ